MTTAKSSKKLTSSEISDLLRSDLMNETYRLAANEEYKQIQKERTRIAALICNGIICSSFKLHEKYNINSVDELVDRSVEITDALLRRLAK